MCPVQGRIGTLSLTVKVKPRRQQTGEKNARARQKSVHGLFT